jgi:peptidoglycan/xylan/chitin deacetylase (PgdA/CDA1 family)
MQDLSMRLRSIGKTCFAYAYTLTEMRRGFMRQRLTPLIVGYHRVVENFERSAANTIPSMLISTRTLDRHIDWLAKRFSLLSLDEIGSQLESGHSFAKPAAAITFDDGYSDVYHHAYPLLKRKGIPAAFFVVTGLADSGRPQVFDRLYLQLLLLRREGKPLALTVARALQTTGTDAKRFVQLYRVADEPFVVMTTALKTVPRNELDRAVSVLESQALFHKEVFDQMSPMTWDMIETMHRGGMTVGSHTASHVLLTAESVETARKELSESKEALEKHLNASIRHFAYPDGRFNPMVIDAVHSAGYRFAYTICHSRDQNRPLLTIPRRVLWERSGIDAFGNFSPVVMNWLTRTASDFKGRCGHDHS